MNVSPGLGGDWHLAGIALLEAVRDFNYVLGRKQGCLPEWESEPQFLAPALAASTTGDGRKEGDRCRGDPVLTTGEQESVLLSSEDPTACPSWDSVLISPWRLQEAPEDAGFHFL